MKGRKKRKKQNPELQGISADSSPPRRGTEVHRREVQFLRKITVTTDPGLKQKLWIVFLQEDYLQKMK